CLEPPLWLVRGAPRISVCRWRPPYADRFALAPCVRLVVFLFGQTDPFLEITLYIKRFEQNDEHRRQNDAGHAEQRQRDDHRGEDRERRDTERISRNFRLH